MKKSIHPAYNFVVIKDGSSGFAFLTKSTKGSAEKTTWTDGKEYPLIHVEISSASHPFYTGKQKIMDTAGRIDKFNKKYAKKPETEK
ncbi:MAG: type B 50S ribosomal protein L31 [Chitinophagaceae bacterium]|nr:type B 50S ribosomal protein L31 [Oligoflexus sp.]